MAYLGIDLGGTGIKAAVVNDACEILAAVSSPTLSQRGADDVTDRMAKTALDALDKAGMSLKDVARVGIGCPGSVDHDQGLVRYSPNLNWRSYPLRRELSARLDGLPTYLANDANVAALGEFLAGSAKGAQSAAVITLGTGVGSGLILEGKILTGFAWGGGEFGHMIIHEGGRQCSCGRRGCWEAYSSATALISLTKEAMEVHRDSLMWDVVRRDGQVSGKTVFDARALGDPAAEELFGLYIRHLACGIANVINCVQPEIVSLGGGVSAQGENLLVPLREEIAQRVYGGADEFVTGLKICTLGNNAGMIGAAMLTQ